MSYSMVIHRGNGKKINPETIEKQVNFLIQRSLGGNRGKGWEADYRIYKPAYQHSGKWIYSYVLTFEKKKGHLGGEAEYKQWDKIKGMLEQTGSASKFGEYPWHIGKVKETQVDNVTRATSNTILVSEDSEEIEVKKEKVTGVRDVSNFDKVLSWKDIGDIFDRSLLTNDEALSKHPCFNEIYGRNAQIRTILSAIQSAVESDGLRRPHGVLWGHAGCGKTSILLGIEKLFGPGSVLRLDATSTTRAGLEKMFFDDLAQVPPLVFMEEIEKANEDALKLWLGALDDRGEVRKVNFRVSKVREIRVLFFCTVNNKVLFDKMMGSDGKEQGALSSRCVTDVFCPRPDQEVLRQILKRDIQKYGGKEEWITPCLDLAQDLEINDPRRVLSFLAGGDRLITGEYQKDRLEIHQAEEGFKREGKKPHSEKEEREEHGRLCA